LPSAGRTAPRAEGARCKAERHEAAARAVLRRSSDPQDRRQLGPAITHLLSAPRTAPRAAGARCKARAAAPPARADDRLRHPVIRGSHQCATRPPGIANTNSSPRRTPPSGTTAPPRSNTITRNSSTIRKLIVLTQSELPVRHPISLFCIFF
jgi:hypothetical protein